MARKMKDSGIEWIGEIPEGWEVLAHKYIMHKEKSLCEHYSGEDVISLTLNGVVKRDLENPSGKMPTTFDGYQFVVPNDLLLCLFDIDVTPRCVGLVKDYGVTSPAYSRFKIHSGFCNAYYNYLLRFIDDEKVFVHLSKNLRSSLTESDFGAIKTIVPPKAEQQRIADYLDNRTFEIDTLLSKARSSIEEYKKLKQAVITQAVTKGVRGKRELKDSGVEWIGEIPAEWNKCKLKNISTDIGDGLHGTPKFDDSGEVYFINGNNFSSEYVEPKFDTKKLCLEESLNYPKPELTEQTIMISLNGSYGKVCLYRYFPMLLGKSAGYITLLPSINRRYVRYYLSSTPAQIIMTLSLNGTTIPNLSLNTLYNFPTILPSASEQTEIADYLDAKCAEIDKLIAKKEQLVKKLESYKKSLIYEVVTGKREV